jgi:hypothetical protein
MAAIVDNSTAEDPSDSLPIAGRQHFTVPDLLGDPRVFVHYRGIMVWQHRQVGVGRDARCACGEPYATCQVALRLRELPPAGRLEPTIAANQWFG